MPANITWCNIAGLAQTCGSISEDFVVQVDDKIIIWMQRGVPGMQKLRWGAEFNSLSEDLTVKPGTKLQASVSAIFLQPLP